FGLGSSIGYFFAMVLISEGDRKIAHSKVPTSFQGLPITLIYISILALAVYGLTGHMISM
ncbi:MAG: NADH:ubiquinone oxidoreductase, subunit RnfA, partial [Oscillospiraceae bacterium]